MRVNRIKISGGAWLVKGWTISKYMNARFVVIPSFKKKRTNTMKTCPLWLIRKRNNDFAAFFFWFMHCYAILTSSNTKTTKNHFTMNFTIKSPHYSSLSVLIIEFPAQKQRKNSSIDSTLENGGPNHTVFSGVDQLISLNFLSINCHVPVFNLKWVNQQRNRKVPELNEFSKGQIPKRSHKP